MTGIAKKPEIFVCEFITGGGLYNAPLAPSLVGEGELMLKALLTDLLATNEVRVATSRDARLPMLGLPVAVEEVDKDPWSLWQRCIKNADLVWLIAPETDGVLEKLSRLVPTGKLIGCAPEAVKIAASKYATAQLLAQHQIPVVPTWKVEQAPTDLPRYVAKPDDGVSCEDTRCFDDFAQMQEWLQGGSISSKAATSNVIQPWQPGSAASISMLCHEGKAWLLSCNRQVVELHEDRFVYCGSVINGMAQHWNVFADIAQRIASVMPALSGYVGVDVMVDGSDITVLEINPRLTTSYVGLTQATGLNVAKLVLDLFYNRPMQTAHRQRNVITIKL
jgi:predicted ATP-grasp superfamily ATP-dependent carboligase